MAFGGSGKIDLSGGDSSAGTGATWNGTHTLYGSPGAPGAPGALLVFLDGQVTNPDITSSKFVANYGACGYTGGTTELQRFRNDSVSPVVPGVFDAGTVYTNAYYTLGGTGVIGGQVVVESGATLSPGTSTGTLAVPEPASALSVLFCVVLFVLQASRRPRS